MRRRSILRSNGTRHPMKVAGVLISAVSALTLTAATGRPPDRGLSAEAQIAKSGCAECHSTEKSSIGPSYHAIALRYRNASGARDALIATVRDGGKGHWTEISRGVPMPPYSGRLADPEIQRIVTWILER